MNIKILVAYHKPDLLIKSENLVPIHVGRDILAEKTDQASVEKFKTLSSDMIGDNTGENISRKNGSYNEMTALYWAWKNYDQLGNPTHIGLMHYRRHFDINKMDQKSAYFECNNVVSVEDYITKELGLTNENLEKILTQNDFIVSKPYYKESVYAHYKESHRIEELDLAIKIIKKYYPKYYKACKKYINGHNVYFCNMFVFPKDIFFKYCEFVFGVLQKYEEEVDIVGKRLFISERITGVFIQYLIDNGFKAALVPTMYLEENVIIPVAFSSDINFLEPTFVAITSLLKNAKPFTIYDIYLMVPNEIAAIVESQIRLFYDKFKNFKINVVDMGNEFADVKMSIKHITAQTYYRLHLPNILKQYNKCFYLDSDIIVNSDLTELFRNNIDEYYIAGVRASGYYHPESWVKKHTAEVGLPSINQYINAGVLLFNLARIREERIYEKMLSYVNKGFSSQDQDILNLVCYDNIKILPLKYNLMTKYLSFENGEVKINKEDAAVYGENECREALKSPVIIHYADKRKPWNDSTVIYFNEWETYSKLSPLYKERKKSKISIIVPVYNMEKYIAECLESIFKQTLKDIEVICINDGSKDRSLNILYSYQKKYNNLFIINQRNQGVAVARNVGLDFANAEYVAFMDPDDYYPENDILEILYDNAKKQNVTVCGGSWMELHEGADGNYIKTDFTGILEGYTFKQDAKIKFSDYQFDFGYQRFIFSLNLLRNHKIKFPIYTRYQDPPFFIKAMIAANEFFAIKKCTYCYRLGYQQGSIYNGKKIIDWTLGIIDELRISSRTGMSKLHRLVFDRINKQMSDLLFHRITAGKEPYLFELLVRANSAIDRKLLKYEIPTVNDNTMLEPLRKSLNYFMNCVNEKRIKPKKKQNKFLYFFKRVKAGYVYFKKYGFKCTIIRIFRGRLAAERYKIIRRS